MEKLTAKEEEIMQILWELKKALVRDIMDRLPSPDLPYTTVSSIVRILEKKGFVSHKPYGKTHEYYPLVTKVQYRRNKFRQIMADYFDNSLESVVSYLVTEEKFSPGEIEELSKLINQEKEKKDDSE
ncbi:MAG: BlaI/MecI/CopY family transcriptional regulator [Bacteroidota bacterium]